MSCSQHKMTWWVRFNVRTEEDVEPVQTKTAACFQCQGDVFPRRGSRLYQHIKFHDKGILKSGVLDR